jgi:hypothetical protein
MNEMYLVTSGGIYGHFGRGETLAKAIAGWKKAGGKKKEGGYREQRFYSDLPFAPADRDATPTEADAFIGQDGSTNYIRCKREVITEAA